jgi:hypothetical protein
MRSINFAIQLRGAAFDIGMSDTQIFDVPMELGLELVAIVGSYFAYTEGELVDDVIDKVLPAPQPRTPRLSFVLTDWLSITPALGEASLPCATRQPGSDNG